MSVPYARHALESNYVKKEEAASSGGYGWLSSWLPGGITNVEETRHTFIHDHAGPREGMETRHTLIHDHAGPREGLHMAATNQQIILREVPHYEFVEKLVEVPEVRVKEVVEDVPQCLVQERVVEVEHVCVTEIDKQVPNITYKELVRELPCPVFKPVKQVVEVPAPIVKERLVEVPQLQHVQFEKQVPKHRQETRVKEVPCQTVEAVMREREVLFPTVVEKMVEVPVDVYEEIFREVPYATTEKVEKIVNRPTVEFVERLVEVPIIELHDRIVEVEEVEIREIVREVPVYETQYIDKPVRKEVYEDVERIVEVPHVVYEERVVEVPEVEVREVVRHVTVPVVQYRDKMVPRHEFDYFTRDVEVPTVLRAEAVVEVAQPVEVDLVTHTPFAQYERTSVEVPKISIQPRKLTVDVPFTVTEEVPRKVEVKQQTDVITEVPVPVHEYKNKEVNRVRHHGIERLVEVQAKPLYEHRVIEVPQVQEVELVEEELDVRIHQEVKEIPRISMEYREKVRQVGYCLEGQTVVEKPNTVPVAMEPPSRPATTSSVSKPFKMPGPIVPTSVSTMDAHHDRRVDAEVPKEAMGIDVNRDGLVDAVVIGADRNRDGIPDIPEAESASFTQSQVPKSSLSVVADVHHAVGADGMLGSGQLPASRVFAGSREGCIETEEVPMAAMAVHFNQDAKADAVVGADRNHDGIPDVLQGAPTHPHINTTSRQLQLSNCAEADNKCRHCGNIFLADSKFCRKCGKMRLLREVHPSEIKSVSTWASMGSEARSTTSLLSKPGWVHARPKSLASAAGLHPAGGMKKASPLATTTLPPTAVHAG